MRKLKGKITICRSHGPDGDSVHVMITDELSGLQFFDGYMTLEEFGLAVTGLRARPIKFTPRGLEHVGMQSELKELVFPVPGAHRDREYATEHAQSFADDGWVADKYFNSQTSFQKHADGKTYAHGYQRRYVKVQE